MKKTLYFSDFAQLFICYIVKYYKILFYNLYMLFFSY